MLNQRLGIEIEMTGITRKQAADAIATVTGGWARYTGTYYRKYSVDLADGRSWTVMSDGSIKKQKKDSLGCKRSTDNGDYSVEVVSPILNYRDDIETLQQIVRGLRKAGAIVNSSCGIHIHIDGSDHTARSIRNLVKIVASKNDLLYKALQVSPGRMRWCKKLDAELVKSLDRIRPKSLDRIRPKSLDRIRPKSLDQIERVWYAANDNHEVRRTHCHSSRKTKRCAAI